MKPVQSSGIEFGLDLSPAGARAEPEGHTSFGAALAVALQALTPPAPPAASVAVTKPGVADGPALPGAAQTAVPAPIDPPTEFRAGIGQGLPVTLAQILPPRAAEASPAPKVPEVQVAGQVAAAAVSQAPAEHTGAAPLADRGLTPARVVRPSEQAETSDDDAREPRRVARPASPGQTAAPEVSPLAVSLPGIAAVVANASAAPLGPAVPEAGDGGEGPRSTGAEAQSAPTGAPRLPQTVAGPARAQPAEPKTPGSGKDEASTDAAVLQSLEVEVELGSGRRERSLTATPDRRDDKAWQPPAGGQEKRSDARAEPSSPRQGADLRQAPDQATSAAPGREPFVYRATARFGAAQPDSHDPAPGASDGARRSHQASREGATPAEPTSAASPAPSAIPGEAAPASGLTPRGAPETADVGHARTAAEPLPTPLATDRVTVHLPDDAGGGRLQISVRGDVVNARIVGGDEAMAARLEDGIVELRGALTRQGFEEAHVRIDPARPAGIVWAAAAGAEAGGAGDSKQQDTRSPERRERDRQQEQGPRSDPRHQQQQGRSQQRARRERER